MKNLLNLYIRFSDKHLLAVAIFWMILPFLIYLGCIAYFVLSHYAHKPLEVQDAIIGYAGLKIHRRKIMPLLKKQVFVRR